MTIAEHLRERHVAIDRYSVVTDDDEGTATFLLYDLAGAIAGYQQYRPSAGKEKKNHPREGRYFTYKSPGRNPLFGLESWSASYPLFITEGIFDAVRIHNAGLAAIATLSNDPKWLRQVLRVIHRPIFAICDPGPSGQYMARYAHRNYTCFDKDLGAMSTGEVQEVLRNFQ